MKTISLLLIVFLLAALCLLPTAFRLPPSPPAPPPITLTPTRIVMTVLPTRPAKITPTPMPERRAKYTYYLPFMVMDGKQKGRFPRQQSLSNPIYPRSRKVLF